MKILSVKTLAIPEIKTLEFARFSDHRGYFTEPFRQSDLAAHEDFGFVTGTPFVQENESFSKAGTLRGLHFQWNPFMGKLVRTVAGHMVDLVADIRQGSPTFGKIIAHDMPTGSQNATGEWIWVPPGFAHGNFFPEDSTIEYMCTGEYSPGNEAAISPLSDDLDWALADARLKASFDALVAGELIISDKDRAGVSMAAWRDNILSANFRYAELRGR